MVVNIQNWPLVSTMSLEQFGRALLEKRQQLPYALRIFLFTGTVVALVQAVTYLTVQRVVDRVLSAAGPQASALFPAIDGAIRVELVQAWWLMGLVALGALALSATILTRFVGPCRAILQHIDRLIAGDYGSECSANAGEELTEVVARLNQLSAGLRAKHGERRPTDKVAAGAEGYSILELLVVLALIATLGALSVSQFISAYDRAKQRSTIADMYTIAAANSTYVLDNKVVADSVAALSATGLTVPLVDRWGFAWAYEPDGKQYTLTSYGADGAAGPVPPDGWWTEPYTADLIVSSGAFVQMPGASRPE